MGEKESAKKIGMSPDEPAAIERLIQDGYDLLHARQIVGACFVWQRAWEKIRFLLKRRPALTVEEVEAAVRGHHSISSWADDFIAALLDAGKDSRSFISLCIDLCREYLERSADPGSLINLNRYRLMAECYFRLGKTDEGEATFAFLTSFKPQYTWGWISWAERYSFRQNDPWYSLEKAESILRAALAEKAISDKRDIAARLRGILTRQGREAEASLIEGF